MIDVRELRKSYGTVTAVDGVSFSVGAGEVFGLLCPNGAGKSTLIRMMTCLTRPGSGTSLIHGRDVTGEPGAIKPLIGVVPQESNLDRELTALDREALLSLLVMAGYTLLFLVVGTRLIRKYSE